MKELFYFGCIRDTGHFLWCGENYYCHTFHRESKILSVPENLLRVIDGTFIPTETHNQGIYKTSNIGKTIIIAWHDYTVDSRPGSNSALIGIGFTNGEEMIDFAITKFPSVMNRQKRPVPLP